MRRRWWAWESIRHCIDLQEAEEEAEAAEAEAVAAAEGGGGEEEEGDKEEDGEAEGEEGGEGKLKWDSSGSTINAELLGSAIEKFLKMSDEDSRGGGVLTTGLQVK